MKMRFVTTLNECRRILIRQGGTILFLRYDEIDWIQADRQYSAFHSGTDRHMVRQTLSAVEEQLDPSIFIRVHRSSIVNLEKVRALQSWIGGDGDIVLIDGSKIRCGRGYRKKLQELLRIDEQVEDWEQLDYTPPILRRGAEGQRRKEGGGQRSRGAQGQGRKGAGGQRSRGQESSPILRSSAPLLES